MKRIIVAYSGGANSTSALRSLAADRRTEVITLHLNLGIDEPTQQIFDQALAAGAARCHVLDVGEEFVRDYVLPALDGDAFDPDRDDLMTLAIPLIARKLVDVARMERSDLVAASPATSLSEAIRQIDRSIKVVDVPAGSRGDVPPARAGANRIHRPARLAIDFDNRIPVALNGIPMSLVELLDCLSVIGRAHGIETRSPALSMLRTAYRELAQGASAGTVCLQTA
jgi:argininosuccinate synthase